MAVGQARRRWSAGEGIGISIELGRAFTSGNHIVAQHAAGKLIWCLRTEDSLRLAILILMVLPL